MTSDRAWLQDVLAGAAPWLVYELLSRSGRSEAGAVAATVVLAFSRMPDLREFKLFDATILAFFSALALFPNTAGAQSPGVLLPLMMAATAFGSAFAGRPCTIQYAKRMVAPTWWENPHFIRVNHVLTIVWGGCFLAAALIAYVSAEAGLPAMPARAAEAILFGAAIWFTRVFPRWYRLHRYLPLVWAGREPYLRAPRIF